MDIELALKYLTKSISIAETQVFERWLNDNELNRFQYEKFRIDWKKSEEIIKDFNPDVQQAWRAITSNNCVSKKRKQGKVARYNFWNIGGFAAAFILLIATTLFFINYSGEIIPPEQYTEYTTKDSVRIVNLPDGSKVFLNCNSELKVLKREIGNQRKVYLTGEAFFDIFHNLKRPFIVQTSNTITLVHGTSFNLKTAPTGDIVSLITGKIKFCNIEGTDSLSLVPGEMVSYNAQRKELKKTLFLNNNFLAWKTKILEFNNTPVEEALNVISNYYHVTVIGNIDPVMKYTLSANFNNQPIEKVLPVLELTWDAKISYSADTIYLTFN
jgi:transmembrane sensor